MIDLFYELTETPWEKIREKVKGREYLIVTDENLWKIYKEDLEEFKESIIIISCGKSKSNLELIIDELIERNFSREGLLLALGGGEIGDLVGFVASIYKRGIGYIQVPTTLLAQVDSSIGGKTGINYAGLKNIIGSFYFPEKIILYPGFLATLDKFEIYNGLGEILKYGLIYDYKFFQYVMDNLHRIINKDQAVIREVLKVSSEIKFKFVENDYRDQGERKFLNFGHTIGHGLESFMNIPHGNAVIRGMIYESVLAYKMSLIDRRYLKEIYYSLSRLYSLSPLDCCQADRVYEIMKNDKKNSDQKIGFVLPVGRGKVDMFYDLDPDLVKETLKGGFIKWI